MIVNTLERRDDSAFHLTIGGLVEKILLELTGRNADFTGFPITSEFLELPLFKYNQASI